LFTGGGSQTTIERKTSPDELKNEKRTQGNISQQGQVVGKGQTLVKRQKLSIRGKRSCIGIIWGQGFYRRGHISKRVKSKRVLKKNMGGGKPNNMVSEIRKKVSFI